MWHPFAFRSRLWQYNPQIALREFREQTIKLALEHFREVATRLQVFSALRHPSFRWLWLNNFGSSMGRWMESVALSWLVLEMTNSPFLLGVVFAFRIIPMALFSTLAGTLADSIGRRKPILISQMTTALMPLLTATLIASGRIELWQLLIIIFISGTGSAFDQPVRQALIFDLVGRKDLLNANALSRIGMRGSLILASPIAGLLISTVDIPGTLYVASAIYAASIIALLKVRAGAATPIGQTSVLRNLVQALSYVRGQRLLLLLLSLEILFDAFAIPYHVLMPVFARDVLHVGAAGYGFLMAAVGVGEIGGALVLAALGDIRYKGWILFGGFIGIGGLLFFFSLSTWYALSLALLVGVGLMHTADMIVLPTLLQSLVPDEFRGRIMGIYVLTWAAVPVGSLQAGAIAALLGAPFAVGLGGIILTLFSVVLALTQPTLRRLS